MGKTASRLNLIDSLRGLTLISMIIYHAAWDLCYLFSVDMPWYKGPVGSLWQQSICMTFILISGYCSFLGTDKKKKLKRGALVSVCGLVITFVTLIFMGDTPVYFGVLTLIGLMMLIMVPLSDILKAIKPKAGLIISLILFILFKETARGFFGIYIGPVSFRLSLSPALYRNMFTALIGFPPSDFFSVDYFPLIPWCFLYMAGYFISVLIHQKNRQAFFQKPQIPFLSFIGRHSLIIYMIHQPVIYFLFMMIYEGR